MDRVVAEAMTATELDSITRREVEKYAADSYRATLYPILDNTQKLYAVILVPDVPRPFPTRVVVMAQVIGEQVVILEDTTDKPLVDALIINGGVPREQIVLAYKGKSMEDESGPAETRITK